MHAGAAHPVSAANRPRWRGEAGFFEIWFLVVFDPDAGRAWWLRWTTFAPAAGRAESPRATVWAAAFDARAPAVALKTFLPAAACVARPDGGVAIGANELGHGLARGRVEAGGRAIAWDLAFEPAARPARREPWWLHLAPTPTRVAHANDGIRCRGWVSIDGERRLLVDAPGVQKHLWGHRRVEELVWLYCPRFREVPAARAEATAVRLRADRGPRVSSVWTIADGGERATWGLPALLANRVLVTPGARLRFRSGGVRRALRLDVSCDPRTLAGYVYRDPSGWDVHVAQSDVATCTAELLTRPHPLARWRVARRLTAPAGAAVEFHHPRPIPGVRYVAWDATHADPERGRS